MRFGLPVDPVPPVAETVLVSPPEPAPILDRDTKLRSSLQMAFKLLNESLSRLTLKVKNANGAGTPKPSSANPLGSSTFSSIDSEIAHEVEALQLEIQHMIENKIKRDKELEEKRLAKEQLERERAAKELEARRAEEAKAKALELEKKKEKLRQQQEQERLAKEQKAKEALALKKGLTLVASVQKELLGYREKIVKIKNDVKLKLDSSPDIKKAVTPIRRKLTVKLGQLSNSMKQLNDVTNEIVAAMEPAKPHKLAFDWLLNFLAKKIVEQAETEVTTQPQAGVPLGRLAINLIRQLPGLEYYLSARFVKKCPFVIGYTGNIDTEEGRERMGWKRIDGKWESEVKYEERMGGIFTVWAVACRENDPKDLTFFSMASQWRFVARLLNTEESLLSGVHFTVASSWWEASAAHFAHLYGKQGMKIIALLATKWASIGKAKSFPAATRLAVLGEEYVETRAFKGLKEMER